MASSLHYMDEPTQIAVLSPAGGLLREYWHTGHIGHQPDGLQLGDLDGDGTNEIFAVGVDNGRRRATMVVLDPDTMRGTNEAPNGYQLEGFDTGFEVGRVFFPRSSMNKQLNQISRFCN